MVPWVVQSVLEVDFAAQQEPEAEAELVSGPLKAPVSELHPDSAPVVVSGPVAALGSHLSGALAHLLVK